jgi:4-alpha-glucanotransferase
MSMNYQPQLNDLGVQIEELRNKMNVLGESLGLANEQVLAISQELDVLIVNFMKLNNQKERKF